MTTAEYLLPLTFIERARFVLRNNRKVLGEWHVYTRDALPESLWVDAERPGLYRPMTADEIDAVLDSTKRVACVSIHPDRASVDKLSGAYPEGVTGYAIARAIRGLDG